MGKELRFAAFVLDPDRAVLLDGETPVPLRPKSFDVLRHLAENAQRVVSRDELLEAVWGDAVVTPDSVRQCVTDIRKALDDSERTMIKTVPRRGYMLDVPRQTGTGAAAETRHDIHRNVPKSALAVLAATVLVALFAAFVWSGPNVGYDHAPPAQHGSRRSVAVVPFAHGSDDVASAYLTDSFSAEVLHRLAQSRDLVVIDAATFLADDRTLEKAVDKLNIDHVLRGTFHLAGQIIRVEAELMETASRSMLWRETFVRRQDELLGLKEEIAQRAALTLGAALSAVSPGETSSVDAHREFLHAEYRYRRRATGDLEHALEHYRRAVEIDPAYARAWVGVAATLHVLLNGPDRKIESPGARADARDRQRHAVEQAIRFGSTLPEVHIRAASFFSSIGDGKRYRKHSRMAESLDPTHWLVLANKAYRLVLDARIEEAVNVSQTLVDSEPLNPLVRVNYSSYLSWSGAFEEALAEYRQLFDLFPLRAVHPEVMTDYLQTLILADRVDVALDFVEGLPNDSVRTYGEALVYSELNQHSFAARALDAVASDVRAPRELLRAAELHAYRGDLDQAVAMVELLDSKIACTGEIGPAEVYYSPFLARAEGSSQLVRLRAQMRSRMQRC